MFPSHYPVVRQEHCGQVTEHDGYPKGPREELKLVSGGVSGPEIDSPCRREAQQHAVLRGYQRNLRPGSGHKSQQDQQPDHFLLLGAFQKFVSMPD